MSRDPGYLCKKISMDRGHVIKQIMSRYPGYLFKKISWTLGTLYRKYCPGTLDIYVKNTMDPGHVIKQIMSRNPGYLCKKYHGPWARYTANNVQGP